MGIRLNTSKTFRIPVNFVVVDAGGKPENWSFTGEFKRLTTEEIGEIINDATLDDKAKLGKILVGWKMEDLGTNEAIEYTPENFELFCSNPKVAGNTVLQYLEKVGGNRQKN